MQTDLFSERNPATEANTHLLLQSQEEEGRKEGKRGKMTSHVEPGGKAAENVTGFLERITGVAWRQHPPLLSSPPWVRKGECSFPSGKITAPENIAKGQTAAGEFRTRAETKATISHLGEKQEEREIPEQL